MKKNRPTNKKSGYTYSIMRYYLWKYVTRMHGFINQIWIFFPEPPRHNYDSCRNTKVIINIWFILRFFLLQPPSGSSTTDGPEVASSTAESLEQERVWLWQQFASHVTPSVQRVVEFAKRVPGFCELSQDDQLILIKVGFFEIWLGHIARQTCDSSMTFTDGTYITKQQMDLIYDVSRVTVWHQNCG